MGWFTLLRAQYDSLFQRTTATRRLSKQQRGLPLSAAGSNRQQENSASPALRCIVGWIDCKLFPRGDDRGRLARKSHPRRRMSDAGSFRESQLYFSFHGVDIVVVSHGEA